MIPTTTFDRDDWRSHSSDFTGETFQRNLRVVDRLKEFAEEHGITLPQLAVAWTLSDPAVDVTIIGARRTSARRLPPPTLSARSAIDRRSTGSWPPGALGWPVA